MHIANHSRYCCTGHLPEKLVLAIQRTECLNGKLDQNCYAFDHNNLSSVSVTVETEYNSSTQKIDVDVEGGTYLEAYRSLFSLVSNPEAGNGLTRAKYKNGNVFFAFEIRPRNSLSSLLTQLFGTIKIEIKFKTPVPQPLTLLIFGIYDEFLTFDSERNFAVEALSQP